MRALVWVMVAMAMGACKNEPYADAPIGIFGLVNHKTKVTNTYKYQNLRLYTFVSTDANGTVTSSKKFYFQRDVVNQIVDSTSATSVLKSSFYYPSDQPVVDSTFLVAGNSRTLQSVRTVNYDTESRPITVTVKTFSTSITIKSAELTWENGNVVRLITYDQSSGNKVVLRDLKIQHDQEACVFGQNSIYLFTISLDELYWLSKNNPKIFNDGAADRKYTYWYNKFGYPSNFMDDAGTLYGVTYTQIR